MIPAKLVVDFIRLMHIGTVYFCDSDANSQDLAWDILQAENSVFTSIIRTESFFPDSTTSSNLIVCCHNIFPSAYGNTIQMACETPENIDISLRLDSMVIQLQENTDHISLLEWYAVKGKSFSTPLGQWSETNGLRIETPSIWYRRNDLGGAVLVASNLEYYPYSYELGDDGGLDGFLMPKHY